MRCHEAEALLAPQFSESLDPAAQRSITESLDRLLEADPATRGRAVVAIPYRTDVYTTRRRG